MGIVFAVGVVVLVIVPADAAGGRGLGLLGAALLSAPRKEAVLDVQMSVDVLSSGARERLDEALLEVFGKECVENGIHGRVGVRQTPRDEMHDHFNLARLVDRIREGQEHLCDPVGKPADDVHGYDSQHEDGDLAMRSALLGRLVLRPDRLQLHDDEEVEGHDEQPRDKEAQQEGVQGEHLRPIHPLLLGPYDVARHDVVPLGDRLAKQVDRDHHERREGPRR